MSEKESAWRDYYLWVMHGFERDLSNNVSWHDLAVRNRDIAVIDTETLADRLRMLHDAKLGPVGRL
jgi:hypothetical protein